MSRACNLNSNLLSVKAGDREDLLNTLRNFGDCDCDFNGENGEGYNWDETKAGGFESNLDYLINKVSTIEDDVECVNAFFDEWMSHDRNYYEDYSVKYIQDSENRIIAIGFATLS